MFFATHLIDGKEIEGTAEMFYSYNPATEEIFGKARVADENDVGRAVKVARQSLSEWKRTSIDERAKILLEMTKILDSKRKQMKELITSEVGKPLSESEDEINSVIKETKWMTTKGIEYLQDEEVDLETPDYKGMIRHEALGVVGVVSPWNFPIGVPIWGITPALLAGNSVVFKPSELTPIAGHELVKIYHEAGIPKNVLNLILGKAKTGRYLVESDINMISFTGSSLVGKEIASKGGNSLKKIVLELGGSDPAIICEDADIEKTVSGLITGRYYNCGQCCSADKRFFVDQKISDQFIDAFIETVNKLKVGNPMTDVNMGPIVSFEQLNNLESQVKDAKNNGATILTGGRKQSDFQRGYFYLPTVMIRANERMRVLKEEVFGPVVPIVVTKNIDDAIEQANNTQYGLGASVWSNDIEKANEISKKLECGFVTINDTNLVFPQLPFGGVKESGIGRELSKHGLWEFCNIKSIMIKN